MACLLACWVVAGAGCSGNAAPTDDAQGQSGATAQAGAEHAGTGTAGSGAGGASASPAGAAGTPGGGSGGANAGSTGTVGGASSAGAGAVSAMGGASGTGNAGTSSAGTGSGGSAGSSPTALPLSNRAGSIPVGIENVNDSPLKANNYRALLRFVPDATISVDRVYFGFKLRGASCWDSGNAGYGAGDGGT